jgi:hypothetical protein
LAAYSAIAFGYGVMHDSRIFNDYDHRTFKMIDKDVDLAPFSTELSLAGSRLRWILLEVIEKTSWFR